MREYPNIQSRCRAGGSDWVGVCPFVQYEVENLEVRLAMTGIDFDGLYRVCPLSSSVQPQPSLVVAGRVGYVESKAYWIARLSWAFPSLLRR